MREEPDLHDAVLREDHESIIRMKSEPCHVSSVNSLGFTALELACLLGKRECEELLRPRGITKVPVAGKFAATLSSYTERDLGKLFHFAYTPYLNFPSYSLLKETIRLCPLLIRWTFLGEENRRLGMQYRDAIWSGYSADVSIQWIDDQIGYGLFAHQDLDKGEYVGEYTGTVRRHDYLHPNFNSYCFHYPTRFFSAQYTYIDALYEGNSLRFLNHSNRPNLQPRCLFDRGLLHLVFFAKKTIRSGEQLTFDYGKDYWKIRRNQAELVCGSVEQVGVALGR